MSEFNPFSTPAPTQQMPSTPFGMTNVQQRLSQVTLGGPFHTPPSARSLPWTTDEVKFSRFESLKQVAIGNCRILYGSERMKFFDIVIGSDEEESTFCAALVCSKDLATKILRTTSSDCPIKAIHIMVDQLQKDTMPLLVNLGAGAQLYGQQGYTNALTGKFELADVKKNSKPDGAVDDTETLSGRGHDSWVPNGAPRGPRFNRGGFKRTRREEVGAEARMPDIHATDDRVDEGLNYG